MKYFLDTEFYERGSNHAIELISIGLVAEDGQELYAENDEISHSSLSPWLQENVVPHLNGRELSPRDIAQAVRDFVGDDPSPEFWGYYADYDWVVFCQLFGAMVDLPKNFPMYCMDLKQVMQVRGLKEPPISQPVQEHHALADARWNRDLYHALMEPELRACSAKDLT